MKMNEKFVEALKNQNKLMKKDIAEGKQWKYANAHKRSSTFAAARKAKNYLVNCVDGVHWAMKTAGVPADALSWYGAKGGKIMWLSDSKAKAKKYFDVIDAKGKTVSQLWKNHELCEGDTLTYVNMTHTNAYIGDKKSFDSGHAFCTGSGEFAPFKKWIGNLVSPNAKVAYIIRFKDRDHYRVQTGVFSTKAALDAHLKTLKSKKVKYELRTVNDNTIVQVGYFSGLENAKWFADDFTKKHKLPTSVEVM